MSISRSILAPLIVIAAVLADAAQAKAQPQGTTPQRKPWEWTASERAAARRDPGKRLERTRAGGKQPRGMPAPADVIDADRNPELFFETELFEMLVRSAFVLFPGNYRFVVAQRSSDLFRSPNEWDRFAAIVADYAAVLQKERTAADALDSHAVTALADAKCTAEAQAIRAARLEFGRKRFDRMLYETVRVKRTYSPDTDFDLVIRKALEREEQCQ